MIDCENEVYTRIVRMLREEFPGINVAGEYTKTPSSFPHVLLRVITARLLTSRTQAVRKLCPL